MLNLRWGTQTDIWSFGTTVSNRNLYQDRFVSLSITDLADITAADKSDMGVRLAYFQA